MGCQTSSYVNFNNLLADGCCKLLAANTLQHQSKEYYDEMRPFVMEHARRAAAADAFGRPDAQNVSLDVLMDIHMLYGYLLAVQYQREWDIELDTVCHRDFGNLYYWQKHKFDCISKYFLCNKIDITKALAVFDIDKTPKLVDGIGHMYILTPATPDCAFVTKACSGSPTTGVDSVSLEDILVDNVSISPAAHSEANMTLMMDYCKILLEGLYPITITITALGGDEFTIQICAEHAVAHPTTIQINTRYHYQPPLVLTGASYLSTNGTIGAIQWSTTAPTPGIYTIALRATGWSSPLDDFIVAVQVNLTGKCPVGPGSNLYTYVMNYLTSTFPGEYSLNFCSFATIGINNTFAVSVNFENMVLYQWILPPAQTQDCTWTSGEITGGNNDITNPIDDNCPDNDHVFHVV